MIKKVILYTNLFFLILFTSCSKKENIGNPTVIPPENVMNIAAAQKTKAQITGERKDVKIGGEKSDMWSIVYKDNQENIYSSIIKQQPEYKNKIGDSIVVYYDSTHPQSLPIYELQYLILSQ